MVKVTHNIEGLADLERQLLDLEPKVARRTLTRSLRKGGNIVLRSAQARVRKDTRLTEKALKVKTSAKVGGGVLAKLSIADGLFTASLVTPKDTSKGSVTVKVGAYKPSPVKGRHKKYPGDPYYAAALESKHPFLRPALDENVDKVVQTTKTELASDLNKVNSRA